MMAVAYDSIARLTTRDEFINKGYFLKETKEKSFLISIH